MDRRQLTQRMRLLGIPILIPAAALVLVAYGLPEPNPVPAQPPTVININGHNPHLNRCWVDPFNAAVGTHAKGGKAKFINNSGGTLVLLFPTGKLLWVFTPPPGGVTAGDNSLKYALAPTGKQKILDLTVSKVAQVGDKHEYDAHSTEGGFCLGHSHPDIIVE